jgi:YYY domain-containing protein
LITITFIKIWFLLFLLGFFGFPIVFTVFRNLPDRGYGVAKYTSLLIISYIGWILGHLGIEFIRPHLWIITLFYFAIGSIFFCLKRNEITEYLKKNLQKILIIELVFILSYGYFIKIVSYDASIVVEPGTEAMMDYMMTQSILQSKVFPQWDLWLAGEKTNYYYYGWVAVAALKLLTDIKLPIMFNAYIALVYAIIFTACFGLGLNFTKKYRYALLTPILMIIIGNLDGFFQVIGVKKFFEMDWFQSARVIEGTINEFPYFSFVYGDLHSYVLAFPIALICLYISLNIFKSENKGFLLFSDNWFDEIVSLIVITIAFGALIPTNTWDYPAYFMTFFISIAIVNFYDSKLDLKKKITKTMISSSVIFALGLIAYSPYFEAFKQKRVIKMVSYARSNFSDFFTIYGTYISITLVLMILAYLSTKMNQWKKQDLAFILFIFASIIIIFHQITYLYLALYIFSGISLIYILATKPEETDLNSKEKKKGVKDENDEKSIFRKPAIYIIAFAILAAFYGLLCEFFYVDDHYDGQLERMNTVFKVYLEMWFIWTAAAAYAVFIVSDYLTRKGKKKLKYSWFGFVGIFIAMGMVYPISSTYTKTGRFNFESTLEGLKRAELMYPADCEAIEWMRNNVKGMPVILESCGNAYSWDSRFATFGGFQTILGWANHEAGWRNSWDEVNKRWTDINLLFQTNNIDEALRLLNKYKVEYVIVGTLERRNYPHSGLAKFEDFMDIVYKRDEVTIYKMKN